jgi:type III secretion system HrpE/YscL family protein
MSARVLRADRRGPARVPGIVHDARADAAAIVARAREEAEALHAQARDEGRAQGRAELAAALLDAAHARDQALVALEAQAAGLALLAAERIVGGALDMHPERIAAIVRPLFERVRRARQLTLRVHPDDRPALDRALPALARETELACAVAIETDPGITRGGCVVTSDAGVLDARVEVRLDALRRALHPA